MDVKFLRSRKRFFITQVFTTFIIEDLKNWIFRNANEFDNELKNSHYYDKKDFLTKVAE